MSQYPVNIGAQYFLVVTKAAGFLGANGIVGSR